MTAESFISDVSSALEDKLVAVYRFGAAFARGPKGPQTRLLVLVRALDAETLEPLAKLAATARAAQIQMRVDTPEDVQRGADVFPVFSLELIDTKELVAGDDVLASLEIHPADLRPRVEQSLRVLHRELIQAYLVAGDDRGLSHALRLNIRKSIYLLRAMALVCELDLGKAPDAAKVIDAVVERLLPDTDRDVWHRMRKFAGFEQAHEHDELVALYIAALEAFDALVRAVDVFECD